MMVVTMIKENLSRCYPHSNVDVLTCINDYCAMMLDDDDSNDDDEVE